MPWQHRFSLGRQAAPPGDAPAAGDGGAGDAAGDSSSAAPSSRDASGHDGQAAARSMRVPLERLVAASGSGGSGTQSAR